MWRLSEEAWLPAQRVLQWLRLRPSTSGSQTLTICQSVGLFAAQHLCDAAAIGLSEAEVVLRPLSLGTIRPRRKAVSRLHSP